MDFWDLLKLMARRWPLVLPLLLLTIAATVWTGMKVKPDYRATGYVTLLPASVRAAGPADGKWQTVNPWTEQALAEAAIIRLQRKDLHDDLAAAGLVGTWEASADGLQPVVTIEVVAPSTDQAKAITHRLIAALEQEVRDRQTQYGLAAGEEITTVTLDSGDTTETVNSAIKRALVVVCGVGLVVTVMLTVAVDAILRRRARNQIRKAELDAAAWQADLESRGRAVVGASQVPVSPAFSIADAQDQPSSAVSTGDVRDQATPDPVPMPEDATIVLPLSNSPWSTNTGSDRGAASEAKQP